MNTNEKINEKAREPRIKIGGIILIVFFVLYVPSLLHWMYGKNIDMDIIRIGVIEDSVNVDGYLVREEEILKSPFGGKCITEIGEGEKVAAGGVVAAVIKDSSIPLLEELKKKDLNILKARMEKNKNQEIFSEDILKIENEIGEKAKLVAREGNGHNLAGIKQIKSEIDALIQKKSGIFGGNSSSDAYINNLMNERNNLQQQIDSNTKYIASSISGIVSYNLDGYESMLTQDSIRNLEVKDMEDIKIKNSVQADTVKSVEVDKPFAKVIKDFEAFIVLALDKSKADVYKVGDYVQEVRINQISRAISGTVYYKSSEDSGKCIVAIKIDKAINETAGLRKINIDLVKTSYNGLKVPLQSLIDVNEEEMTAKIILNKSNYASIRKIKIVGMNDEYAVIESMDNSGNNGVSLYDMFILNPQNIQEGQLID